MTSPSPVFAPRQRAAALAYGLVNHVLFAAGVGVMMAGLFTGMAIGRGPWRGAAAWAANALLIAQFPILHSYFLGRAGRGRMARLAPFGLGKDLGTTLFSMFASAQLLIVFLLWSPSGAVWYRPHSAAGWTVWGVLSAAAWLLLVKGMTDAGLAIQMGSLGWWSVFRGRKPDYPPFQVRGLYKWSRQPVYLAFALTLWTGAVWTPDRLALALVWTAYCVTGPLFKERRYRRTYGELYSLYQDAVPYWIPRRARVALAGPVRRVYRRRVRTEGPAADPEVIILGAGPVGLLLANLLGERGLRILLADKRTAPPDRSMAIGVTPPSLRILRPLGLDRELIRHGVPIRTAVVHGSRGRIGSVSFDSLPGDYPFILSVPQAETQRVLEAGLAKRPSVRFLRGVAGIGVEAGADAVEVRFQGEGAPFAVRAPYLAACDGHKGPVRDLLGIPADRHDYGLNFLMADVEDRSGLGSEAHLFFTDAGSVESFPLPGGWRRWVVLTERYLDPAPEGYLERAVRDRAGFDLAGAAMRFQTPFHVRRSLSRRYVSGRVVLCGDAAHVLSPIGGQGMNTGFADAEFLADSLAAILRDGAEPGDLLTHYEVYRRRAFAAASARASAGMWLGTRTGRLASRLRDGLLRRAILRPPLRDHLPAWFAMMTLPFHSLDRVPAAMPIEPRGARP